MLPILNSLFWGWELEMRGNGWNQTIKTQQQSRNCGNKDVSGDPCESFLSWSEGAKFSVAFKSHRQGIPKAFKSHQNGSKTSWNFKPAAWWQSTFIRLLASSVLYLKSCCLCCWCWGWCCVFFWLCIWVTCELFPVALLTGQLIPHGSHSVSLLSDSFTLTAQN